MAVTLQWSRRSPTCRAIIEVSCGLILRPRRGWNQPEQLNWSSNPHVRVVRGGSRWHAIGVTGLSTSASCSFLHEFSQEFGHVYVIAFHSRSIVGMGNDPYRLAVVDRYGCTPRSAADESSALPPHGRFRGQALCYQTGIRVPHRHHVSASQAGASDAARNDRAHAWLKPETLPDTVNGLPQPDESFSICCLEPVAPPPCW